MRVDPDDNLSIERLRSTRICGTLAPFDTSKLDQRRCARTKPSLRQPLPPQTREVHLEIYLPPLDQASRSTTTAWILLESKPSSHPPRSRRSILFAGHQCQQYQLSVATRQRRDDLIPGHHPKGLGPFRGSMGRGMRRGKGRTGRWAATRMTREGRFSTPSCCPSWIQ